jgi:hypothetical protein
MILPDFILSTRQNQQWDTSGLDSIDECLSKSYFSHYPHEVSYNYNSRGFRDEEWVNDIEELKNSICPYDFIWVRRLEKLTQKRTINISMDGASNDWISRKVLRVMEDINPKFIVIHWSYFDRRESSDTFLIDEERRLKTLSEDDYRDHKHFDLLKENLKHTLRLVKKIEETNRTTRIVHSIIYDEICNYPYPTRKNIHKSFETICKYYIPEMDKVDISRDGLHYGVRTSELFASKVKDILFDL